MGIETFTEGVALASQTPFSATSQSISVVQLAIKPVDKRRMHGRFHCTAFQPFCRAILSFETIRRLTTNAELPRPGTLFFIQQSDLLPPGQFRPRNYHPTATTTTYHSNNSKSPFLASTPVAFGIMDDSRKSLCTPCGRVSAIKKY